MKKGYGYIVILILVLFFQSLSLMSQNHARNWYFGNKAGLVFDGRYPIPLTDGQMNAREGVASYSDTLGNLMFYTDGKTLWNSNHDILTQDLAGDPLSTMSAYALPSRIHDKQFILLTTSIITNGNDGPIVPDGGHYYILDFSASNPEGKIIDDYNTLGTGPIQEKSVEKILGIPFPESIIADSLNKPGYWMLSHKFDTVTYKVSKFDETFHSDTLINVGESHSNGNDDFGANRGAIGYIAASLQGDKIAIAVESSKMIEVLRFDNVSGGFRRFMQLPAGEPGNVKNKIHGVYGLAFSPSGRFLYATSRDAGIIYQWDFNTQQTVAETRILRHKSEIPCGALQLAPNGKIYVAIQGQDYLGVINRPDRLGKRSAYNEYGVSLKNNETAEGGTSTLGLPQFDMSDFEYKHFGYDHNCFGDTTQLFITGGGVAGGYGTQAKFTIYDIASGLAWTELESDEYLMAQWLFPAPGEYDIKIESRYNGRNFTITERIEIHDTPKVKLAEDYTRMCRGDSLVLDAGIGSFYEWADESYRDRRYTITDEDFEQIPLQEYRVKVTDYRGCVGWDTVHVEIKNPPEVDFEYTRSVCDEPTGSATVIPKLGADRYFYRWEDFPDNTTNKIENVIGGDYVVYVTSKFEGCESANVAQIPQLGVATAVIESSATDTICPGETVKLTVLGEGATDYEWINPAGHTGVEVEVNPLVTTKYEVLVIAREGDDQCETVVDITVPVQTIVKPEMDAEFHLCEGDTLALTAPDGFSAYMWSNSMVGQEIEIYSNQNLILTVMDRFNCVSSDTLSAFFHSAPEVDLGEDLTMCTNQSIPLSGGTGQEYLWSTGEISNEIGVNQSGVYWLRVGDFGCFNSDTVEMNFLNPDSLFIDSVGYQDITCFGAANGRIEMKVHGVGSMYLYSLDGGTTFLDNNGIFTNLHSEYSYELAVMEDSLCVKEYDFPITIQEPDEIKFDFHMTSPSCLDCIDGSITLKDLKGGTEPYTIQWNTLEYGTRLRGVGVGYYSVDITDANNCISSERVFLDMGFRIPNAFTPNGDGQNDTWDVKPLRIYPLATVKIFNMNGRLVFDSPIGYPEPWDGTFEGNPLPTGTYYYIITLMPEQKPYTGNLTLIR